MLKKLKSPGFWLRIGRDLLILLVLFYLINLYQTRHTPTQAPVLQAVSIKGTNINLQQLTQNSPVILYFWGSWCPLCTLTSSTLSELSQDYQVLSIALSSGSPEQVRQYLHENKYIFTTINDPDGQISTTWGVQATPTIIIVDKNGKIVSSAVGVISHIGLRLRIWWYS